MPPTESGRAAVRLAHDAGAPRPHAEHPAPSTAKGPGASWVTTSSSTCSRCSLARVPRRIEIAHDVVDGGRLEPGGGGDDRGSCDRERNEGCGDDRARSDASGSGRRRQPRGPEPNEHDRRGREADQPVGQVDAEVGRGEGVGGPSSEDRTHGISAPTPISSPPSAVRPKPARRIDMSLPVSAGTSEGSLIGASWHPMHVAPSTRSRHTTRVASRLATFRAKLRYHVGSFFTNWRNPDYGFLEKVGSRSATARSHS